MGARPSDYERRARDHIRDGRSLNRVGSPAMRQVGWPLDRLGTLIKHALARLGYTK